MSGGRARDLALRWSGRHLPVLSEEAWARWSRDATELARDRQGLRTLRSADGARVIKEFGLKRVLSSALLRPYALRFVENAARLLRHGLPAPEVEGAWRRLAEPRHVVSYAWRPGVELREALRSGDAAALVRRHGATLARLHDAGAEFRSGHLGNWLVQPEGGLAILDCVDVTFRARPLSPRERAASVGSLLHRDAGDRAALLAQARAFCEGYFGATELPDGAARLTFALLPGDLSEQGFGFDDLRG